MVAKTCNFPLLFDSQDKVYEVFAKQLFNDLYGFFGGKFVFDGSGLLVDRQKRSQNEFQGVNAVVMHAFMRIDESRF